MRMILKPWILGAMFLPAQLAAQEPQSPDIIYSIRLFDTVLAYAPPPWVTTPEDVANVETFRNQVKTQNGTEAFVLEFIPKGESFEDWSRLYAVFAETPLDGTLEGYRNGQFQTYLNACTDAMWQISTSTPEDVTLFSVFCPSYKNDPATGEVAVFAMLMHEKTLVKNYYHMRVPAYRLEDLQGAPGDIPLPVDEVRRAMIAISRAQLVPAP